MLVRIKSWAVDHKALLGVLFMTVFLLVYRISYRTFWMDETWVLTYFKYDLFGFLSEYWRNPDNHPPLYYFLVLVVSKILPWSEFAVRLVSAVSGLGIVVVVYLFSLRVSEDRRTSLLVAFFTAFSSYFILISQMARYHSLAAFFALLTFYFFYWVINGASSRDYLWYLAALVLTAYSDYVQFFYAAALTNLCYLYCLIWRQVPMKPLKWIYGQLVAAGFCIPLVWMIYNRIVIQGDGGWSNLNLLGNSWANIIGGFFFHFYVYFFGENIFPWNYVFFASGALVLSASLVGFILGIRNKYLNRMHLLVIVLAAATIVLNTLFMNVANPRYNFIVYPKFGFVAYPLFVMSLIFCITAFQSKKTQSVILLFWALVSLFGLKNFYNAVNYLNPSYFRTFEAFEFVRDNSKEGQMLATTVDAVDGFYYFYKDKYFANLSPLNPGKLQMVKPGSEVWFFSTAYEGPEASVSVLDRIPPGFEILKQFDSVPLDPRFKLFKERILRRPSYTYKYSVYLLKKI